MQLAAVIIPPPDVVEDALVVARGLVAAAPEVVPRQRRPGLLGRLLGRPDEEEPASIGLFEPEPSKVFVRLVKLGHVSEGDAASLTGALRGLAEEWVAPVLHVSSVSIEDGGPRRCGHTSVATSRSCAAWWRMSTRPLRSTGSPTSAAAFAVSSPSGRSTSRGDWRRAARSPPPASSGDGTGGPRTSRW